MKINSLNYLIKADVYKQLRCRNKLVNLLGTAKENKTSKYDIFIHSAKTDNLQANIYSKPNIKMHVGMIGNDLMDALNFDNVRCSDGILTYNGVSFTANQIPEVDSIRCREIKAENNVINFEKNSYYKYTDKDGTAHCMTTNSCGNYIGLPTSDFFSRRHDKVSSKNSLFWNYLSGGSSIYVSMKFSDKEQRQFLDDAGIKKGFFTVKMGNKVRENYYSNSGIAIIPKWCYDE